jgi:uncharacterized protein YecT (DUF1311 family)
MRILPAAILFSVASAPAFGMDCADQTQLGLDKCADASFQRADHALNDAYREVVGRLGGDERKKRLLAAAETAWIALRDAECNSPSPRPRAARFIRWSIALPRRRNAETDEGLASLSPL